MAVKAYGVSVASDTQESSLAPSTPAQFSQVCMLFPSTLLPSFRADWVTSFCRDDIAIAENRRLCVEMVATTLCDVELALEPTS